MELNMNIIHGNQVICQFKTNVNIIHENQIICQFKNKCWNQWPFVYSAEILILSICQTLYQNIHTYDISTCWMSSYFSHSEFSIPMLYYTSLHINPCKFIYLILCQSKLVSYLLLDFCFKNTYCKYYITNKTGEQNLMFLLPLGCQY